MKTTTGIWLDKRTAKLVTIADGAQVIHAINSNIEEFHPQGGSGSKLKGGPQDVVQDSKYLERQKHQRREFFKNIADSIKSADSVVIFGPAQTGEQLYKVLSESYPEIYNRVKGVEKVDSMTENQIKAWVRNYFSE